MRLLGRTGQLTGRTVAVNGPLKIGRAPENDLQLSVDGVSRQHAQLTPDGDGFWIEDLNSANGTFLNGVRVTKERLAHLDVITLGRVADLIVDARSVAAPAASPVVGDAFLEAVDGPEDGTRIAVPAGELTIGRVAPSNVLIDSRVVSKLHARLRRTTERLALDDLDSPNGTFVNGARITTNRLLHDGDTISIAGVRSYRVHVSGGGASPVPAAVAAAVAAPPQPAAPAAGFSQEWKTKLVWSADELSAVEAERARVIAEVRRSTGGLPGESGSAASGSTSQDAPAPARKTEFIGRDSMPLPPDFAAAGPPPVASASAAAPPPARKTEFLGRDSLPMPPDFPPPMAPPAPAVPAPAASAAPVAPGPPVPKTTVFRPGADLPPVFAEAPPVVQSGRAPAAAPMPATSAFRPGADLPPTFSEAPTPPRTAAPAAPAAPDVLCLRGAAGEFTLTEGTHVVGRQEGVSIFISDRQVSRNHAVVTVQNGRVTIEDRASANGTFVNGERLSSPRVLKAGDQLKFGDLLLVVIAKK
jgi:pSer/pThr/pTyr-binding forkhead associated (FHA) protein